MYAHLVRVRVMVMVRVRAIGEALRVVRAPVLVVRLELVAQQVIVHLVRDMVRVRVSELVAQQVIVHPGVEGVCGGG